MGRCRSREQLPLLSNGSSVRQRVSASNFRLGREPERRNRKKRWQPEGNQAATTIAHQRQRLSRRNCILVAEKASRARRFSVGLDFQQSPDEQSHHAEGGTLGGIADRFDFYVAAIANRHQRPLRERFLLCIFHTLSDSDNVGVITLQCFALPCDRIG